MATENTYSIERTTGVVTPGASAILVVNDIIPLALTCTESAVDVTVSLLARSSLSAAIRLGSMSSPILVQTTQHVMEGAVAKLLLRLGPDQQAEIYRAASTTAWVEVTVSERTGPRNVYAYQGTITLPAGGGGGGSGDMLSAAPIVAGSLVTTAHAMPANQIDTTKILETKTISGATTFTLSATPAANTRGILRLTNSTAGVLVVTLPASPAWYSESLGTDITTINVPANWVGEISWVYDGTKFRLKGDPVSAAQVWTAQNVPTNAVSASEIDWSKGPSHSKTLSANTTFTFANALDGQTINVAVTNTAGNFTVTWPTVQWPGGAAPTQTVGAKTDVYTFTKVGAIIFGNVSANHS